METLIPLGIAAAFAALVVYSVSLQRRSVRKYDKALATQQEAIHRVNESLEIQRKALAIQEQILAELKRLNGVSK